MNINSPLFGCGLFKAFATKAWRSSLIILFFGPEPITLFRSIPNSLANFLVAGPACVFEFDLGTVLFWGYGWDFFVWL